MKMSRNLAKVRLTGECAHDFALQFLGNRVAQLGGNIGRYILCCETPKADRFIYRKVFTSTSTLRDGGENAPMRCSFIFSSTGSMSS